MGAWLKQELAPLMQGLLSEEAVNARGLFHPQAVRSLMDRHETNRIDGTDRLLALMNLEIWARMYLDHRSPQDVTAELEEVLA
jgi:asparagine synthase (glutamine-hydrolysing)